MPARLNNKIFKARIRAIHGASIRLIGSYAGLQGHVEVSCLNGHKWSPTAASLFTGHGCKKCTAAVTGKSQRLHIDEHKQRIEIKYDGNIAVLAKEYLGAKVPIAYSCRVHGKFTAVPGFMMGSGEYGCAECSKVGRAKTLTLSESKVKARLKSRSIKLLTDYKGARKIHQFRCAAGHTWRTTADSVMRISGCPTCNEPTNYSQIALRWMQQFLETYALGEVKHAGNGGEIALYGNSGRRYKVDGFIPNNNIILEFNGDAFHGNPAMFAPDDKPHPFRTVSSVYKNKTAKDLYDYTVRKARDLQAAGYTVISVWETDFKAGRLFSPMPL